MSSQYDASLPTKKSSFNLGLPGEPLPGIALPSAARFGRAIERKTWGNKT